MGKGNFSDDFKRDAVRQITERVIRLRRFRNGSACASIRSTSGRRSSPRQTPRPVTSPKRSSRRLEQSLVVVPAFAD